MIIYISHSSNFDFKTKLYEPLREIFHSSGHSLIFPHEANKKQYPSKMLFQKHKCDQVLAEVSYPSTGQGIELGWADAFQIPIIGIVHIDAEISGSLSKIIPEPIRYHEVVDIKRILLVTIEAAI